MIALAMWRTSFGGVNHFGLGSAIAVFLCLLVVPALALNIRRFRRRVREQAANDSAIGEEIRELVAEGRLVPDDVTNELVRERPRGIPPEQGIVLDGYPRTAAQAAVLHRLLAESGRSLPRPVVVRLDVPRAELLKRLRRRRTLDGRRDDTDEAILRRLQIHDAETPRVLDAVSAWADVVTLNGAQPVESVTSEIDRQLDALRRPAGGDSRPDVRV